MGDIICKECYQDIERRAIEALRIMDVKNDNKRKNQVHYRQ